MMGEGWGDGPWKGDGVTSMYLMSVVEYVWRYRNNDENHGVYFNPAPHNVQFTGIHSHTQYYTTTSLSVFKI